MREFFKRLFESRKRKGSASFDVAGQRAILKEKVEAGTKRALREYGEVFHKLAEYDRS